MEETDTYLLISGIQHFAFCHRQWALAYIEEQWAENLRTVEGHLLHLRAHDAGAERQGDTIIVRDMPVLSHELRVRGMCDVVEFHADPGGITLKGKYGRDGKRYRPVPVEYKRGKPKENEADLLQLCAQAMCLEEMLLTDIPAGEIFYGEPRRRLRVTLDTPLRSRVRELTIEMRNLYDRGYVPKVKTGPFCRACSLMDICLPKLCKEPSVEKYIDAQLTEAEAEL